MYNKIDILKGALNEMIASNVSKLNLLFFLKMILQFENKFSVWAERGLRILCTQLNFNFQSVKLTQYCKKI